MHKTESPYMDLLSNSDLSLRFERSLFKGYEFSTIITATMIVDEVDEEDYEVEGEHPVTALFPIANIDGLKASVLDEYHCTVPIANPGDFDYDISTSFELEHFTKVCALAAWVRHFSVDVSEIAQLLSGVESYKIETLLALLERGSINRANLLSKFHSIRFDSWSI